MNKEQLIEEMAKCKVCYQEFGKCPIENKSPCRDYTNAENMYERGYRKVPDGAVILTPEERDEELKACNEKQAELEAEIDRLKADNEALKMRNEAYTEENEKLKGQNAIANVFLGEVIWHLDVNNQIDRYEQADDVDIQKFAKDIKEILQSRSEGIEQNEVGNKELFERNMKNVLEIEKKNAVKEFAEKLKAKAHSVVGFNVRKRVYAKEYTINEIDINELLKEFLK